MQIFGGLHPVSVGPERDRLIALLDGGPDPVELVAFLSRRFAPVRLRNTEGDPLMLCEASLRVEDPLGLSDALDEAYGPPKTSPMAREPGWNSSSRTACNGFVRRSLCTTTTCESTPTARPVSIVSLAAVRQMAPSAVVLSETRQPLEDARDLQQLKESLPAEQPAGLDQADSPELAAVLADAVRRYESPGSTNRSRRCRPPRGSAPLTRRAATTWSACSTRSARTPEGQGDERGATAGGARTHLTPPTCVRPIPLALTESLEHSDRLVPDWVDGAAGLDVVHQLFQYREVRRRDSSFGQVANQCIQPGCQVGATREARSR